MSMMLRFSRVFSNNIWRNSIHKLSTSSNHFGALTETEKNKLLRFEKEEKLAFDATYKDIKSMLRSKDIEQLAEASDWCDKSMDYNVPHGKRNRGLTTTIGYRLLASEDVQTNYSREIARVVGWCVEMMQAHFLVTDDVMDNSYTRRGQLCWYKQDAVGFGAINDALILRDNIFHLLRVVIKGKAYYSRIVDLFLEMGRKTTYGQEYDVLSSPPGQRPNIDLFTMDRYVTIVKYKGAFYSFILPVRLAMYMAEIDATKLHSAAEAILVKVSRYFQVQDDFLDAFGDPNVTGKIGTDVAEGKCCWPIVVAMQKCNARQKQILKDNYGSADVEAVSKVMNVYEDLKLRSLYKLYEEQTVEDIYTEIDQASRSTGLNKLVFYWLLAKITKRNK